MGKIHLNTLHTDDGTPEDNALSCPRCHSDESLGFSSDGDRHHCRRCQLFFQTRQGDLSGHGRHRDSGPAISER